MSYQYEFDKTSVGDLRLSQPKYEVLHQAYCLLRDELDEWNQRVAKDSRAHEPYSQEVSD